MIRDASDIAVAIAKRVDALMASRDPVCLQIRAMSGSPRDARQMFIIQAFSEIIVEEREEAIRRAIEP